MQQLAYKRLKTLLLSILFAQVKCKSCNELLVQNAIGCLSCGTPIGNSNSKPQTELNQIEFEQKGDTKRFKASFSDNVGQDLVATFGGMLGAQIPKKKILNMISTNIPRTLSVHDNEHIQDTELLEEDEEIIDALNRIFKIDGETLVFQTSNYKEKNKLDKEIRISVLVLLGYKHLHNANEIKRSTLNEVLKRSKLNTPNFRKWIARCEEIVQLKGSIISLTPTGNTTAIEVLREVIDSNVIIGSMSFSKSSGNTRKTKTANSDGSNTSSRSSKTPKLYLLKLIDENFFKQKRTLSDVIIHLKNDHAVTLKSTDISGHMSKFVNNKTLKREKGASGYEYYI